MSLTVARIRALYTARISRKLDVSAVEVAKGFVSLYHQRRNVIPTTKNGGPFLNPGLWEVLEFHSVSSRGAEMSI